VNTWQRRIDRPNAPAVPIRLRRMHRTFWCPPRYETLARYVAVHPQFTQREAAEATGYSIAGLHRALEQLRRWGALIVTTTLGRPGRTRATLQSDVLTENVSPTGERVFLRPSLRFSRPVTVVETFSEAPASWTALRDAAWMQLPALAPRTRLGGL
jgi:hypothetical protein